MEQLTAVRSFGGQQLRCKHYSPVNDCDMTFSLFLPQQADKERLPLLYWLSGLTCNDENFVQKAGAQRVANELGIIIVAPDTSPRGEDVADDPDGAYDFGLGAGFYVNATQSPFSNHYQMYDYLTEELPPLLAKRFPVAEDRVAISGHSMGGHGALTIALKNPGRFRSVSAFAPIVAPSQVPWGEKALAGYLGGGPADWRDYDAVALVEDGAKAPPMLLDQGDADQFLAEQLKPQLLVAAAKQAGLDLDYRERQGYDHSYFMIATFIEEHLRWHAQFLKG